MCVSATVETSVANPWRGLRLNNRRSGVGKVPLSEMKDDDSFDCCLENDPRFLRRVEGARKSLRARRGVRLEDVK
jgi:hypothetical protein